MLQFNFFDQVLSCIKYYFQRVELSFDHFNEFICQYSIQGVRISNERLVSRSVIRSSWG